VGERFERDAALGAKNDRLKRLRRLIRQRQARSEERAFVAEGPLLVVEALQAPHVEVLEVYAEEPIPPSVVAEAEMRGLTVQPVVAGGLRSVLDTVAPQPVCAVVKTPESAIAELPALGPVLVLVELRDPGNVGTLIRTAEAAGFVGVVLAGDSVDSTNPKVVRAAAGARFRLPVIVVDEVDDALTKLGAIGRRSLATVVEADADSISGSVAAYDEVDLTNSAILLGNEAHGLSSGVVASADLRVTVPLAGPTESLNVAAAGAVLCFESLRQRRVRESLPE